MTYNVHFSADAIDDVFHIHKYIAENDSEECADYVRDEIHKKINTLVNSPERGAFPAELLRKRIRKYREIYWKPYRIVYHIVEETIFIDVVFHGKRRAMPIFRERLI